jgi:hypothetical protein
VSKLSVEIKGPSTEAKFTLDGDDKPLTRMGKKYIGSYDVTKGTHRYRITVRGAKREEWSATVATDCESHEHDGDMSSTGRDTSGTRPIEACS